MKRCMHVLPTDVYQVAELCVLRRDALLVCYFIPLYTLYTDEPTTGLDSRAAQMVIRSIKRVAASGRSVVCTIHQVCIFVFISSIIPYAYVCVLP